MEIKFDVDQLTLGQVEFLEDFTGLELEAILKYAQGNNTIPFRLLMAIVAIGHSAEDPAGAGLQHARKLKLKDVTAE